MHKAETEKHVKELVEEDLKHIKNWFDEMKLTILKKIKNIYVV